MMPSSDKEYNRASKTKGPGVKELKNTQPLEALRQLKGLFDWNHVSGQALGDA